MIQPALTRVLFVFGLFQKGLTSVIQSVETVEEAVGEDALLSCQILLSENVEHVTWQKQTQDGGINLAGFNDISGSRVISAFRGKVEVKDGGLHNSSIVIKKLTEEDEGCYLCLFFTNPAGALTGRTCLKVYELHEPVLHIRESNSTDEFLVSCSATGRPAPTVTLNLTQQDFHLSQNQTVVINTNGLDEGSGSASRSFIGTWIVVVTFLCTASVLAVLSIRKLQSRSFRLSYRDQEKTEVPQTADADTIQVALSTLEESSVRKRSPPSDSRQEIATEPGSPSKVRSLQSDQSVFDPLLVRLDPRLSSDFRGQKHLSAFRRALNFKDPSDGFNNYNESHDKVD
ncbi:OX-2 membrane glycoprotein-like [Limanda limanda]|uniref:OX-2 membrane glycoprotein-like n=1 Tax=Limanda limanda TaxID=27771 RepID=UPI0029C87D00|nr:OX-2 membrane glycoprotein-like [Limanda limanda]